MPIVEKRSGSGLPFLKVEHIAGAAKKKVSVNGHEYECAEFIMAEYREVDDQFGEKDAAGNLPKKPALSGSLKVNAKERADLTWTPNNSSFDSLVEKYGKNTDDWMGKTALLCVREYNMKDTVFTPEGAEAIRNKKVQK